jgi:hypothetical protein
MAVGNFVFPKLIANLAFRIAWGTGGDHLVVSMHHGTNILLSNESPSSITILLLQKRLPVKTIKSSIDSESSSQ